MRYFVKMNEAGDAPVALYRWDKNDKKKTISEKWWDKEKKVWENTNAVTESMFTGGDIEETSASIVKKFFPDAL